MTPRDYYPVGTRYGSYTRSRPYFSRMEDGIYLTMANGDGVRLDPDAVRELVVAGIMALQDAAYDDEAEGLKTTTTLAAKYLQEIGIPKL